MNETPTNKQLRDKHRAKQQRALARKSKLHERRVWLTASQESQFLAVTAILGPHIHSQAAALKANGKLPLKRRGASENEQHTDADIAKAMRPPADASPLPPALCQSLDDPNQGLLFS